MSSPAVSVVIPAYNAADFIESTLDTVRAQTFKEFEIVLVDDGSGDGTAEVAQGYLKRHGLAGEVIRQENKKISAARNAGMRRARGPYIALLDHDDLWYPGKLERVMRAFHERPGADLVCHGEDLLKDGRKLRSMRYGPAESRMYERLLFRGNALSPSASTFKKDKALEAGGFRENPEFNTVEDYDFWMRLSRAARFYFLPEVLGAYQLVERAASRRVVYHHKNLEALIKDHFDSYFGGKPGWLDRLKMRRRLSAVYRSALRQLASYGEDAAAQREYRRKMLKAYPFDLKNLAAALMSVSA